MLVMVPPDKVELLRGAVDGRGGAVRFVDMTGIGRNPARIIPAQAQFFAGQPGRASVIGEPIWPGRDAEELAECHRHESLINFAFDHTSARILCPYDAVALDRTVVADAWRSHPAVVDAAGQVTHSSAYADPVQSAGRWDGPLPAPPPEADVLAVDHRGLAPLRRLLRRHAALASLDAGRTEDLVLAASEAATNSIRHTHGPATLRVWRLPSALVCEITDTGRISDPLAGRRVPGADQEGQRGLWLINQVCDLVQLRTTPGRTTIRMQIRTG